MVLPMLTHPDVERVWYGPRGMQAGIEACIRQKCVVSAVTLIYTSIDALAALTRPLNSKRVRPSDFKKWVDDFLLAHVGSTITAADMYGARCGIVHTYSPVSDSSRNGDAKEIVYRWRDGHRPDDPILAERAKNALVLEIEVLFEALQRAVESFQARIGTDAELKAKIETHVSGLLCYEPWHPASNRRHRSARKPRC
jgi:hypothetical protein